MIKVVSLYCGAGGGDLGLSQAGLKIVFAVDNNEDACKTYEYNHDLVPWDYAVQTTPSDTFPECDVIVGGPPCQSFSSARTRKGNRDCSGLSNVIEMQRIVKDCQPKMAVCENVPTLLDLSMSHIYSVFYNGFTNAGYNVVVFAINALNCGLPQNRQRIFFCCLRNDLYAKGVRIRRPQVIPCTEGWAEYLGYPSNWTMFKRIGHRKAIYGDQPTPTVTTADRFYIVRGYVPDSLCRIFKASRERELDKLGLSGRYINMAEMALLQGFPKDYIFFGETNSIMRQIGNAWPVPMGKVIGEMITQTLKEEV